MLYRLQNEAYNGLTPSEILGRNISYRIKDEVKKGTYKTQQEFFDIIQERLISKYPNYDTPDLSNKSTYSGYLKGSSEMQFKALIEIADELHCSIDWLLNVTYVNKSPTGTLLYLAHKMGYDISDNTHDPSILHIKYNGQIIEYSEDELLELFKNILDFCLYNKTK